MIRQRVRIRFHKEGDLRLIGHRDLIRVFERLLRRAELKLSMSEGFHPKARMSFPSALSLGIEGLDEVMEFELAELVSVEDLARRLAEKSPPGLRIGDVRLVPQGDKKPRLERTTYRMLVPSERRDATRAAIDRLIEQPSCFVQRAKGDRQIDLKADLESLALDDDGLCIRLRVGQGAGPHPRDVLAALGLADLEEDGCWLTRTRVEVTP